MIVPTPEEMANWPPPNFVNPVSNGHILIGLTTSTMGLALIFLCIRFYGKGVVKNALGLDDWIMLVATVCSIPVSAFAMASLKYGLGLHIWDQKEEWKATYGKLALASEIFFPLACSLTKISLCLTYLRLFPGTVDRWFCHILNTFVVLYTITCIFLMLFQCAPFQSTWNPNVPGTCINIRGMLVAMASLNSVSDFFVYLWPAKSLWSLQLPLKQRLGLISIFTVGCIVCVAGICRMYYIEVYFDSYDLRWNATAVYTVMSCEMNLGIICGCLSGVKPVLSVLFPRYFTSSNRTGSRLTPRGRTTNAESFPFQPLSGVGSTLGKTRDQKVENVSVRVDGPEDKEQGNYAWASSSIDVGYAVPEGSIGVEQVVTVLEEGYVTPEDSRKDTGSEEWIMEDVPAGTVR